MKYKGNKLPYLIAQRLAFGGKKSFSSLIIRLAIAGVAVSVAIMIISVAIVTGFQRTVSEKVIGFSGHIEVSAIRQGNAFEHQPVNRDSAIHFKAGDLPGIMHVQVFGIKPGIIKAEGVNEGILLKGVDRDFNWDFFRRHLKKGSLLSINDSITSNDVLISKYTADKLDLDTGDNLVLYFIQEPVRVRRLHIAGIFETGLQEFDKLYAISDLKHVQQLNGWSNRQVSGFEVQLDDLDRLEETRDFIDRHIGIDMASHTIRDLNPKIFDWLGLLDTNVDVILGLMAIVACINMITALFILIIERTNMIGILKSLGSRNSMVRNIFLYQSVYLVAAGLFIGNLLGVGLCLLQKHTRFIRLDQETYYTDYAPVHLEPLTIVLINVFTLLVCMAAILVPVRQISRISPLRAIRFD